MFEFAEFIEPERTPFWDQLHQVGVTRAVATLTDGETGVRNWIVDDSLTASSTEVPATTGGSHSWEYDELARLNESYEEGGFTVAAIEDNPPLDRVRFGLDGRDEQIEWFCTLIRSMGRLGIPVLSYSFMSVFDWIRTSIEVPARGGALSTEYDHRLTTEAPPIDAATVDEEAMWANLEYFLQRVVPVAEEAGVRLALHPDDPPLSPVRGITRIIRSIDALQRALDLVPSDSNGLTFCQGNTTLMTDDLPGAIRRFGDQGKIFYVHFRDVRGTPDRFVETFQDDGQTDMLACMREYKRIGFEGVMRSDHTPTLAGDTNDKPGYSTLARLFAVGYMTGLREAAYGKEGD
jgi:mannonate dehydratase